MAKIVDKTGKYVSREAVEKRRKILGGVLAFTACLFSLLGLLVGVALEKSPLWTHAASFLGFAILLRLVFLWSQRKIEGLERERAGPRQQAESESAVAMALVKLPGDFTIINGLNTPLGPVDHVLVGPTGLFVLDEKKWKGLVSTDGNGELLWNGHPIDKSLLQEFGARVKGIRESLSSATPGLDPFAQALLVLTSASVETRSDATDEVQCIHVEELNRRILDSKLGKRLKQEDIARITKALLAIAETQTKSLETAPVDWTVLL